MDTLATVMLSVLLLFLTLHVLWCRPAGDSSAPAQVEDLPDPQALRKVGHRLDVLAAELERLDSDPDIYAKAFRTHAARSAYQALLAEATQLGEASRFVGVSPSATITLVDVDTQDAGRHRVEERTGPARTVACEVLAHP